MRTFSLSIVNHGTWQGQWPEGGQYEPCYLCGRPVRVDRPHHRIEVVDGGVRCAVEVSEGDLADAGYMGTYPVGPKCKAQIPTEFRIRSA